MTPGIMLPCDTCRTEQIYREYCYDYPYWEERGYLKDSVQVAHLFGCPLYGLSVSAAPARRARTALRRFLERLFG